MTEAPPATQTDRGVEAPPERASITRVRTSSTARIIGRVVIVGVFAMSATNAFSEAMNEARDILRHAPEPMPAVMLFQFAVALTSTLSALGTWRRTRWATRAIVAWGLVEGTFVALLRPLLDLPKDALPGLVAGAASILVIAGAFVWWVKRDQRPAAHELSAATAPVHNRQERM